MQPMSLSDRLARAAQQREGVPTVDPRSLLAPPPEARRERSIILDAHVPVAAVEPDPDAEPGSVCPTCGRTGELGMVDLHRHTSDWSCLACGTLWRVDTTAAQQPT